MPTDTDVRIMRVAANEIARLRQENARLRQEIIRLHVLLNERPGQDYATRPGRLRENATNQTG